jgi:23S rRNA (pseudouridine1915-N3)-methyltransferase
LRIVIAAVGRLKRGPEFELVDAYRARLPWPVEIREVEEKRKLGAAERKAAEGRLLLAALPRSGPLVALDERGAALTSAGFAERLAAWLQAGGGTMAFAIGGADGLDKAVLDRAAARLAFGAMTWPHLLVRTMLMEQLYRAHTIWSGHPYHRP